MGTVYYLARPDNRTLFELGKVYELTEVWDVREYRQDLAVDFADRSGLLKDMGTQWEEPLLAQIVDRVIAFVDGRPVQIVTDEWLCDSCGDVYRFDDEDRDLRIVGSSFPGDGDWEPDSWIAENVTRIAKEAP